MKKWMYTVAVGSLSAALLAGCFNQSKPAEQSQQPVETKETTPAGTAQPQPTQQQTTGEPEVQQPPAVAGMMQEPAKAGGGQESSAPPSSSPGKQEGSSSMPSEKKEEAPVKQMDEKPAANPPTAAPAPAPTPAQEPKVNTGAVEQVKERYKSELLQIKDQYLGQLQAPYNQAIAAKKSGKSNEEVFHSFSQRAGALQEESQAQVNRILLQMKNDLVKQNLPTDSVNEFRAAFYAEVDKAKVDFTAKAKKQLGM